jgi:hypothetical protein
MLENIEAGWWIKKPPPATLATLITRAFSAPAVITGNATIEIKTELFSEHRVAENFCRPT